MTPPTSVDMTVAVRVRLPMAPRSVAGRATLETATETVVTTNTAKTTASDARLSKQC
jgi:hypothetical protein